MSKLYVAVDSQDDRLVFVTSHSEEAMKWLRDGETYRKSVYEIEANEYLCDCDGKIWSPDDTGDDE